MKPWEETWAVDDDGHVYEDGDVTSVADTWGVDDAVQVARGHLIATAPELYRALYDMVAAYDGPRFGAGDKLYTAATDALAKARGEK